MRIYEEPIDQYCRRIRERDYFSFAGYSDAEWFCLFGTRVGERTAFGQIMCPEHGERLLDVLRRRQADKGFLIAIPKILYRMAGFNQGQMDWFLGQHGIKLKYAYERDMVTDDLAAAAGLYPLVKTIRDYPRVVMIGNQALSSMGPLLFLDEFIPISSPNLHMEPGGIEKAVEQAKAYGQPAIYLVSAGVSAAIIVDQLHDTIPESFFIDCGSIWDAFCGIGGQREWRAKLYDNPQELERWKRKNLTGE